MSKDITILFIAPAIFTKDSNWAGKMHTLEPGSIVILPEDAVLVIPPNPKDQIKEAIK
jgi:hypothetical protein